MCIRDRGYEFEPEPFSPFCRRLLCEPRPLGSSLAAFFGYIYIQDRSSMLPPLALAPRQGEAVLDMCASPGSKTGFLGQLTGPDGFVLGNELSRARLATLRANLHACNLPHVGTCSFEGQALPLTPGTWDAIQLDPPCSGWGTVEKNPQVLKLWQGDKLKGLVGLQQLLLAHAARLLRPDALADIGQRDAVAAGHIGEAGLTVILGDLIQSRLHQLGAADGHTVGFQREFLGVHRYPPLRRGPPGDKGMSEPGRAQVS